MDKKEKVQFLADRLRLVLDVIDNYMNSFTDEDFELLEESRKALKEKININNSALTVIMACGGNYDDTEDVMKLKTLDCFIEMLNIRKEYRDAMIEKQQNDADMQDILNLFGL